MYDDIIYQHDKLKYNKVTANRYPGIIYTNTLPDSIFVSISLITTSKIINAYVDDVLVSSISANSFGSIKTQLVFNVPSMATYTVNGGIILNWVELWNTIKR